MFEIPLPILVLQHPQEPSRKDKEVSSAQILQENLKFCHTAVGLSWRNLSAALNKFEGIAGNEEFARPSLWATLYLGTKKQSQHDSATEPGIYFLDKKGELADPPEDPIGGLILLDGTWAQAKTMWWRNPWLLKTRRIHLVPKQKSRYGSIRKEPRPECVSTVEAAAETLTFIGIEPEVEQKLIADFAAKLAVFRKRTIRIKES
ncbi:MAG: DTW domain-containing protein [Bdellovibrionales bacterium]|nr:DTW domain-containing protein [Bdellovibrionales bacterium]